MNDEPEGIEEDDPDEITGALLIGPDGVHIIGTPPPSMVSMADQIGAAMAQKRTDAPVARAEEPPYDVKAGWARLHAWMVERGLIEPEEGSDG